MDIYPIALWLVFLFVIYTGIRQYEHGDAPYEISACLRVIREGWNVKQSGLNYTSIILCLITPFISKLFKIRPVKVFRDIYPFFYALMPVFLYLIFKEIVSPDKAFIGALFYVCFPTSYQEIPNITKSMIAELFMVISLYFLFKDSLIWVGIFGCLALFSHYSVGIILLGWLGSTFLVMWNFNLLIVILAIVGLGILYFSYFGGRVLFPILRRWLKLPPVPDENDAYKQLILGKHSILRDKWDEDILFIEAVGIGEGGDNFLAGPFFYERFLKPPYYLKIKSPEVISVLTYLVIGILLTGTLYWILHPDFFLGHIGMTSILFFSGMIVILAYFKKFNLNRLFLSRWIQFASIPMSILFGVSSYWIPVPVLGVILVSMLILAR